MECAEILYDHYKESNELSQNAQKQRNRYFCGICILEIINFVFLLYPAEVSDTIIYWLQEKHSLIFPATISVIQGVLWVFIVYFTLQYLQKNIYIERQYEYLSILEQNIADKTKLNCFCRESTNYNNNYPLVLTIIDIFYKWVIPITMIVVNSVKIIFEYIYMDNWGITIFDTICYLFLLAVMISYIKMMNFNNK